MIYNPKEKNSLNMTFDEAGKASRAAAAAAAKSVIKM